MPIRRVLILLAALLLLAACGADDESAGAAGDTAPPTTVATEAAPDASEPATGASEATDGASEAAAGELTVAESDLGPILADSDGMTLYVFDNDAEGTSTCTGECEANWPPVSGDVTAGEGVDADLLGTTEREDGTSQATYDSQPLYYFAGDQAAGDTAGQGVGDIWWVVGPDGAKITDEAAATSTGY